MLDHIQDGPGMEHRHRPWHNRTPRTPEEQTTSHPPRSKPRKAHHTKTCTNPAGRTSQHVNWHTRIRRTVFFAPTSPDNCPPQEKSSEIRSTNPRPHQGPQYTGQLIGNTAHPASRRFDLNDEQLLTHLNSFAPQTTSWVMLPPPPEALLNVISALRMQRPERQWAAIEPRPPTPSGNNVGYHSFPTSTSPTLTSPASTTKSQSFGCLPEDSGSEHYPAVTSLSELRMYATKFYVSQRSSPNWGPKTLDSPQPVIWTQGSPLSTKDGQTKTRHHGVSNPCRYPSSITPQTIKSGRMQLPTAPSTWPGLPSFTYSDQVNTANPKTTPL